MTFVSAAIARLTRNWLLILGAAIGLVLCSLALSWISSDYENVASWYSFLILMVVGGGLLGWGWWSLREFTPPRWLAVLVVCAAFLRLLLGTVWFVVLPTGGYASPAERVGYVMADAYNRDRAAWQLSQYHKPLNRVIQTIRTYKKFDQYGGMLVTSAVIYRLVGGPTHQPLMIVVITASFSVLAVLFIWAFARRVWGEQVAKFAAVGVALYPEAILLSSTQMREAFLIALFSAAFYGLARYIQLHSWRDLVWIAVTLLICLPFSPPATELVILMLAILALFAGNGRFFRQYKLWIIFVGLALIVFIGIWFAWSSYAPSGISNPLSLMAWWVKISAGLQERATHNLSGWIQKIFGFTPHWAHLPLLLAYGVVRPFLPAALADTSSTPIWRLISIWRALGWMPVLILLFYAPFLAFRKSQPGREAGYSISRGLCVVIWLAVLTASLRAGADEWDNPRYRAMFAGLQIALVAWVLVESRLTRDPWLKRSIVGLILVLSWFVPWYFERYAHLPWPVVDFFKTLALGIISAILYLIWDLARTSFKNTN